MYEFKMDLFYNFKPEVFNLFVHNFSITLEVSGTLAANSKIQNLHTILHSKVLQKFDTLCFQIDSKAVIHLDKVLLYLGTYFYPVNALSK